MSKEGHFYYWICNLMQKFPFLWSKKDFLKKAFHPHFLEKIIIFRSIFHFDGAQQSDVIGFNLILIHMHCANVYLLCKCLLFIWITNQNLVYLVEIADGGLAFAPFNHVDSYKTM